MTYTITCISDSVLDNKIFYFRNLTTMYIFRRKKKADVRNYTAEDEIIYHNQTRSNPTNLKQGEVLTVFCNFEEK